MLEFMPNFHIIYILQVGVSCTKYRIEKPIIYKDLFNEILIYLPFVLNNYCALKLNIWLKKNPGNVNYNLDFIINVILKFLDITLEIRIRRTALYETSPTFMYQTH